MTAAIIIFLFLAMIWPFACFLRMTCQLWLDTHEGQYPRRRVFVRVIDKNASIFSAAWPFSIVIAYVIAFSNLLTLYRRADAQ